MKASMNSIQLGATGQGGSIRESSAAFLGFMTFLGSAAGQTKNWLPDMDLNHDKQIQNLLCYRYTIGQAGSGRHASRLNS